MHLAKDYLNLYKYTGLYLWNFQQRLQIFFFTLINASYNTVSRKKECLILFEKYKVSVLWKQTIFEIPTIFVKFLFETFLFVRLWQMAENLCTQRTHGHHTYDMWRNFLFLNWIELHTAKSIAVPTTMNNLKSIKSRCNYNSMKKGRLVTF